MTTIYVLKASGGSYDDAWENNLYAVADQTQAELDVLQLKEQHEFLKSIWPKIDEVRYGFYEKIRGVSIAEKLPAEPKGPARGNKETMTEYRRLHAEWRKECEPIWQRQRQLQNELMQQAIEAAMIKARELGCTEAHLKQLGFYNEHSGGLSMPSFDHDVHYTFEELELR